MRRLLASVALAAAVGSTAACADPDDALLQATPADRIEQLPADLVPASVLGLDVRQEDMTATIGKAQRSFIDGVGMWSMRRDDLVQATLQVTRFNPNARPEDPGFRQSVVQQIGGSVAQEVRVGEETVFLTTANRQTLGVWFEDDYFFVLAVRQEFDRPRTLLREAIGLEVAS